MKLSEISQLLNLEVISGGKGLDREVTGGYASDLLSDVIGSAGEGNLWITLQVHHNVVAVASLKDLAGIIIVKGFQATEETIKKSNDEGIPVLSTGDDTFTVAGRLYELLRKE